jgi:hypothetical protein
MGSPTLQTLQDPILLPPCRRSQTTPHFSSHVTPGGCPLTARGSAARVTQWRTSLPWLTHGADGFFFFLNSFVSATSAAASASAAAASSANRPASSMAACHANAVACHPKKKKKIGAVSESW